MGYRQIENCAECEQPCSRNETEAGDWQPGAEGALEVSFDAGIDPAVLGELLLGHISEHLFLAKQPQPEDVALLEVGVAQLLQSLARIRRGSAALAAGGS